MEELIDMKRQYFELSRRLKMMPDEKGTYMKTPSPKQDVILERTRLAFAIADRVSGVE